MSTRNRERAIDKDVKRAIAVLFDEGRQEGEKFLAAHIGRKLRDDFRFVGRVPETRTLQRSGHAQP